MSLTQAEQKFLAGHRLAMLATVGPDGGPQNKPVGYAYNDELGTIDIYGLNMAQSAKYRNVDRQPLVALAVDNPSGVGSEAQFLEIRGQAETVTARGGRFSGHGAASGGFAPVARDDAERRGITVQGIEQVQFPAGVHEKLTGDGAAA